MESNLVASIRSSGQRLECAYWRIAHDDFTPLTTEISEVYSSLPSFINRFVLVKARSPQERRIVFCNRTEKSKQIGTREDLSARRLGEDDELYGKISIGSGAPPSGELVPLYCASTHPDPPRHDLPSPVPMCPQVCQCEPAGRVDEPRRLSSAGVDQTMMLSCLIWSCSVAMPPICAWPPVDRAVCMFVSVCVRSLSPQHMLHSRQECSRVACSLGLKQKR